jgi:hypothetical protein
LRFECAGSIFGSWVVFDFFLIDSASTCVEPLLFEIVLVFVSELSDSESLEFELLVEELD